MKKLTKRVQAGGLWFDVDKDSTHIAIDRSGEVFSYKDEIGISLGHSGWMGRGAESIGEVSFDDEDWRDCCWYVGDQTDSEAVERREWMARGVDLFMDQFVCRGGLPARVFATKIRAGEVE